MVWGMQKLKIRENLIWLSQKFFDEDLEPVKAMTTLEIQMLGGKLYPKVWRMRKADEEDKYTELNYQCAPSPPPAQSSQKSFWKNMDTHWGGRFKTTGTGSRVTYDTIFAPVGTGIMTATPISD